MHESAPRGNRRVEQAQAVEPLGTLCRRDLALNGASRRGELLGATGQLGPASNVTDRSVALNLFESTAVGDLLGDGQLNLVKYGVTLGQLANLAAPGQNFPYSHTIGAYDASTGQ